MRRYYFRGFKCPNKQIIETLFFLMYKQGGNSIVASYRTKANKETYGTI